MDLRRVRTWEWLTGLGGVVLLVSLFLPWYSLAGDAATGWEAFSVVDVLLAIAALGAIGLPIIAATQRAPAVPQSWSSSLIWVLLVAVVLAIVRLINPPADDVSRDAGVWIAAITTLVLAGTDIKSMRDKSFPGVMRPHLDIKTITAPTADGTRRDGS